MSEHRLMIIKCEDKAESTKENYIALSSEYPHLSEDTLWEMGEKFIKYQKSDHKIRWTIFGPLELILVTDCNLPLSDRLNDIIFKPVYKLWEDCGNDEFLADANPIQPFIHDQPIPDEYLFAKHYMITSHHS